MIRLFMRGTKRDHRVYALMALLNYELPKNAELAALNCSRDIVWG